MDHKILPSCISRLYGDYFNCHKILRSELRLQECMNRSMEGRTDRRTDGVIPIYPLKHLFGGGIITCRITRFMGIEYTSKTIYMYIQ